MKIYYALLSLVVLLFSSCDRFEEYYYDFPKQIVFPAEGGTQTFAGGVDCPGFYIYEGELPEIGKTEHAIEHGDSWAASYGWINAELTNPKGKLVITASPNDSKESRLLRIHAFTDATRYAIIEVIQEGKVE